MENELSYLNDTERLKAFETITAGCSHLWSKGKLQEDRLNAVLDNFMLLAEQDPFFLAHFTSYAINKLPSKDLKVVAVFANALSDADGTPFSAGSNYNKPNLRSISQAAIQDLDPKLVSRVIELANRKTKLGTQRGKATHFPRSLKRAIKKYVKYRENNPRALQGIRKVGFSSTLKNIYRNLRIAPSNDAAKILGWAQKGGNHNELSARERSDVFNFKGFSDIEIAEKIRADKLPPTGVLGALPKKISPVVAVAILEQASGDQAVILSSLFEDQGLLKDREVKAVFSEKIKTAKTALDRVERFKKEMDTSIEQSLKSAKAEKRKSDVGDIGKVFLHIDISSSMQQAIEVAKESGATIAECVKNPKTNFHWGTFNTSGRVLPKPASFEKDAFYHALYNVRSGGMTNCLALYDKAREKGCEVDVYITDQGHNGGDIASIIKRSTDKGYPKPKAAVIVNVGRFKETALKRGLEAAGIPVTELDPSALNESALVSQAIKTALLGATAVIDEIMAEPLLELPKWWYSVKVS